MKLLASNAKDVSKNAQFSIISFDFGCRYTHIFKQAQQILEKQTKAKLIENFKNKTVKAFSFKGCTKNNKSY